MAGFKELEVWQVSKQLAVLAYDFARQLPIEERYGLVGQLQRAAVSIPCNIAEGYGRRNPADYCRFLRIAKGSLNEVETLLIIATELGYPPAKTEVLNLIPMLGSKLSNLIEKINSGQVREESAEYVVVES